MKKQDRSGVRLHIRRVEKAYESRHVLRGIELDVEEGEFVAVIGRSGCGKSTLLRLLAGLDQPTGGEVSIQDKPIRGVHPETRIMFQDARLLPWKRLIDNVALGLKKDTFEDAEKALQQVGLFDRRHDWPHVLSGGQKQRIALARALASRPRLLLLDEPLGALDALTRIEMQALIESLWLEHQFTTVLITHDVEEAAALADRIVLIEDGRIAMDVRVPFTRPRRRGDAAFASLVDRVLNRVLGHADIAVEEKQAEDAVHAPAYNTLPQTV